MVKTNSGIIVSGVGSFTITLTNGTFSDNGDTKLTVNENVPFKVKWNDISGSGVVSISKADPHFQSTDTIVMGTPISFTYKLATLKGQTPNIILSNSNPSMGNTQPVTVSAWNDMVFQNITMNSGYGTGVDLKVEKYEWTLPSGWTANGKTGKSVFTVPESKSISIIPDLFTIGEIKVRAMDKLDSAGSEYKTFTMDRGFKFTSYPTSITFGDNTTRTFSVAAFPGLAYEWSVPAGWQINSGQGTNTVLITPGFCSVPNDKIKVRLKSGNAVSDWLNCPTQIATPYFSSSSSTVDQYGCLTLTLQNIDLSKVQSVSISNNVSVISNQGADYTILFPTLGSVQVTATVLLKDCTTPIIISAYIIVNPSRFSITGPSAVCPGSSATFTISNAPCSAAITWACSSNLNMTVSGNTATVNNPGIFSLSSEQNSKDGSTNNLQLIPTDPPIILECGESVGWIRASISGTSISVENTLTINKVCVFSLVELASSITPEGHTILSFSPQTSAPATISWNVTPSNGVYFRDCSNSSGSFEFSNLSSGPYTITASTNNACGSSQASKIVGGPPCVGCPLFPAGSISVYPNPVSSILSIEIDQNAIAQARAMQQSATDAKSLKTNATFDVRLYNKHGRLLRQATTQGGSVQFNVTHLHDGIYYLHIYDGVSDKPEIHQIMVKH